MSVDPEPDGRQVVELRHLAYALQVAQSGSFSRAAPLLRMSQPSLSAAIAQLERELGSTLFDRSSRGVTLTPTGLYLCDQAERILSEVEDLRVTVRSMESGATGSLNVGIAPVLAWRLAPPILQAFTSAAPRVVLSVRERNAGELLELILAGEVDVALVATASTDHLRDFHRGELSADNLGTVPLVAALPERFSASPDPITLAMIAAESIALPPISVRTHGLQAGLLSAFERSGLPPPRVHEVPSLFEAIPLAIAGVAVAIIPEGMRAAVAAMGVVVRRIADGPFPLDVSVVYRQAPTVQPPLSTFIDIARLTRRDSKPPP
ncbi:MAG: LysR family transcriptional regulator [Propioniciclava sp.]